MSKEAYNSYDGKYGRIQLALSEWQLKALRTTTHPRDSIFAVECLNCGGFWQPHEQPFHFKNCPNPFKEKHKELHATKAYPKIFSES